MGEEDEEVAKWAEDGGPRLEAWGGGGGGGGGGGKAGVGVSLEWGQGWSGGQLRLEWGPIKAGVGSIKAKVGAN